MFSTPLINLCFHYRIRIFFYFTNLFIKRSEIAIAQMLTSVKVKIGNGQTQMSRQRSVTGLDMSEFNPTPSVTMDDSLGFPVPGCKMK